MTIVYSRMIKAAALAEHPSPAVLLSGTKGQVRKHLSSVASATDDEFEFPHDAEVWLETQDNGDVLVLGKLLDHEPNAPYLKEGWTPEQDIEADPLPVASIDNTPVVVGHFNNGGE